MGERVKDNLFITVRVVLMLIFSIYGFLKMGISTGVSVKVLLLVSFFIAAIAAKEMVGRKVQAICLLIAVALFVALLYFGGKGFVLLGVLLGFEILAYLRAGFMWFFLPYLIALIPGVGEAIVMMIVITLMTICYVQHEIVIASYKKQVMEETIAEQSLKRDIESRENEAKAELKKNLLQAENHILEEKAALSQTLHDKLGHNINGSIYQLEASKVIMDMDPEKTKEMLQGVIDQLRTGMDEIREILRRERPEKKRMALLQLYELCEDCNRKGVEAELTTEGDLTTVSNEVWEVILDNCFEAVTNSMKYSKCKHINIVIIVMNKLLRCTISDDGIGCSKIVDGMGISGMRQRIRKLGGNIDFETEAGFKVSMLLKL